MACQECNRVNGFPRKYPGWVLCRICFGKGELVTIGSEDREIIWKCHHCLGRGTCQIVPKK